ncbi:MAG: NERD domain-containing protein [Desulfovibrionaceae bacterium]|nr:NERD domain-containing protein [Desulfovibrionaceae bacterium]
MIFKERDGRDADIRELEGLLELELSARQRSAVERELGMLRAGESGERDSAYHIDFHFGPSGNWAVLHDLRLTHGDRVAQIDHLLVNRCFKFVLLESKRFKYGVKISETGEFAYYTGTTYQPIPSPLEQNERHLALLRDFLRDDDLVPSRLGLPRVPCYECFVLVPPQARIVRPQNGLDTTRVIPADQVRTKIMERLVTFVSAVTGLLNLCGKPTLRSFAEHLARLHTPGRIDYRAKFAIAPDAPRRTTAVAEEAAARREPETAPATRTAPRPAATAPAPGKAEATTAPEPAAASAENAARFFCARCKKGITPKAAAYCFNDKKRFGGRAYCFECQKAFPHS